MRSLFQRVGAIQSVALGGDEAGAGDDTTKFTFVGAIADTGGVDHVFFDQNAADIVGAELQTDLANFDSRRKPARLNVINVVEIEAADGQCFQIIDSRCLLDLFAPGGVFRREDPRNERGEAASVFLNAANAVEMIDAVLQFFAAAKHHRCRGAQAETMRGAMHVFPIVARALKSRDFGTDFVVENFRAAAGNGGEARIHETKNDILDTELTDFRHAQNFRRRKAVQMYLRIALLDGAQKIFVILDLQIRMQAALEQDAVAAELEHLFDLAVNFLEGKDVALFRADRAIERAEGTILRAEVRVIDVAVDLVGGDARVVFLHAQLMRFHADAEQVIRFQHFQGLLFGQCHELASFREVLL